LKGKISRRRTQARRGRLARTTAGQKSSILIIVFVSHPYTFLYNNMLSAIIFMSFQTGFALISTHDLLSCTLFQHDGSMRYRHLLPEQVLLVKRLRLSAANDSFLPSSFTYDLSSAFCPIFPFFPLTSSDNIHISVFYKN
jgi:hypothetical protein